jgi:hypothetical protein
MMTARIVPDLDELDERYRCFGLGIELALVEKLAFESGDEAIAHRVVLGIPNRFHGRPDSCFFASVTEGYERILRALVAVMDDTRRPALADCHVHRVKDELCLQVRPIAQPTIRR